MYLVLQNVLYSYNVAAKMIPMNLQDKLPGRMEENSGEFVNVQLVEIKNPIVGPGFSVR
jgi:hypothetical protein